ncbi:SRPBCC domain-containing protein [Candidatus Neomarinimicrobiota bacterium]
MTHDNGKITGKTRDVGYQIGVRRTIPAAVEEAWDIVTSPEGVRIWLGGDGIPLQQGAAYSLPDGAVGMVRVIVPGSHIRITWQPPGWPRPSLIQLRVIPKGRTAVIAFHQEHLPDFLVREERRLWFRVALEQLEQRLAESRE